MIIALRKIRESKGISAETLGDLVGVSKHSIWGYETGRTQPDPETLCRLADALDVSLDLLVRGKEKDHSEEWSKQEMLNRLESLDLHDLQEMVLLSSWLRYRRETEPSQGQGSEDKQ